MASAYTQDLPPPGGYSRIVHEKVPIKKFLTGRVILFGYFGGFALHAVGQYFAIKKRKTNEAEQRSGAIAVQPFLLAEFDRRYLRTVREARDSEAELMKNIKGWEVGTLFGSPIYNNLDPNEWYTPDLSSIYTHLDPKEVEEKISFRLWH